MYYTFKIINIIEQSNQSIQGVTTSFWLGEKEDLYIDNISMGLCTE